MAIKKKKNGAKADSGGKSNPSDPKTQDNLIDVFSKYSLSGRCLDQASIDQLVKKYRKKSA